MVLGSTTKKGQIQKRKKEKEKESHTTINSREFPTCTINSRSTPFLSQDPGLGMMAGIIVVRRQNHGLSLVVESGRGWGHGTDT